jgi:phage tail-like protein
MAMTVPFGQDEQVLYGNFAFHVQFVDGAVPFAPRGSASETMLGAFSEISGLEASMEHKVVRQGGVNYGARMLAGPVSFGTVILKRGVARSQTLWAWWSMFAGADGIDDPRPISANRCDLNIGLIGIGDSGQVSSTGVGLSTSAVRNVVIGWKLVNAMPVKFRVGDLSGKGSDVAVEELHLVHEGLHVAGVAS